MNFKKIIIIIYIFKTIYFFLNYKNKNNIIGNIDRINFLYKNNNKKIIKSKIFKNYINIIYFGYTHCPDICPKVLENILNFIKWSKIFYKKKFVFITIDNVRDNIEILQKYLSKFKINNLYSISSNNNFIEKISLNYRVIYSKFNFKNYKKFKINHSSLIYMLDNKSNINFIFNKIIK